MRKIHLFKNDLKLIVAAVDILIYIASFYAMMIARFGTNPDQENIQAFSFMLPWFVITFVVLAMVYRIYSEYAEWNETLISIGCIVALSLMLNLALTFLLRQFAVPRTLFALSAFCQIIALSLWRYYVWRRNMLLREPRRALLIVQESQKDKIIESLRLNMSRTLMFADTISFKSDEDIAEQWGEYASQHHEIEVVVFAPEVGQQTTLAILDYCIKNQAQVLMVPNIYDVLIQNARLLSSGDLPLFQLGGLFERNYFIDITKRLIDLVLSALGIIILLPVLLFIAIMIKLDSKGPIFYRQTRVGQHNKHFNVYKFRTMVQNAEQLSGPVLAAEDDPRITRVGRFLRNTRLDEFPQLWNVLVGDMSIVGPRPERPYFVDLIEEENPEFSYRHIVPTGITGLAQIEGRYSTLPEQKLSYDLIYAQSSSLIQDLVIMLRTLQVIFQKKKAS
ncbi:MAG: sugar transferase [Acidobacteriota bacterium]